MHTLDEIMTVLIASVPKTGQTTCYNSGGSVISCAGTGQDGEKRMGSLPIKATSGGLTGAYTISEWTGTRFTSNGDGTVTDNVTGLIWLQDANCGGQLSMTNSLIFANGLASGSCGLTDGSSAGDWRLPNANELHSLIDRTQSNPALPSSHPFTNVRSTNHYWSSTGWPGMPTYGALIYMGTGSVTNSLRWNGNQTYAWPVRGGQ